MHEIAQPSATDKSIPCNEYRLSSSNSLCRTAEISSQLPRFRHQRFIGSVRAPVSFGSEHFAVSVHYPGKLLTLVFCACKLSPSSNGAAHHHLPREINGLELIKMRRVRPGFITLQSRAQLAREGFATRAGQI